LRSRCSGRCRQAGFAGVCPGSQARSCSVQFAGFNSIRMQQRAINAEAVVLLRARSSISILLAGQPFHICNSWAGRRIQGVIELHFVIPALAPIEGFFAKIRDFRGTLILLLKMINSEQGKHFRQRRAHLEFRRAGIAPVGEFRSCVVRILAYGIAMNSACGF